MARQAGSFNIVGSIDNLTFYQMSSAFYVRMKSSLTRQQFFSDPAFEGSRKSASLLAKAAVIASSLYRQLPKDKKARLVYQQLTGKIKLMLQDGMEEPAIAAWFDNTYLAGDKAEDC
jgi:hypothetical protein